MLYIVWTILSCTSGVIHTHAAPYEVQGNEGGLLGVTFYI